MRKTKSEATAVAAEFNKLIGLPVYLGKNNLKKIEVARTAVSSLPRGGILAGLFVLHTPMYHTVYSSSMACTINRYDTSQLSRGSVLPVIRTQYIAQKPTIPPVRIRIYDRPENDVSPPCLHTMLGYDCYYSTFPLSLRNHSSAGPSVVPA